MLATNAVVPATRSVLLRTQPEKTASQKASSKARAQSMQRDTVLNYVTELMTLSNIPLTTAVELLLARAEDGALPAHLYSALSACATGKSLYPSRSTLCLWHKNRRDGGIDALIPQHKGKVKLDGGWEARAIELYSQPSKPNMSSVHRILTEVEGFECSYAQVANYLNALPAQLGKNSPHRMGKNLYRLKQKAYVRRTTENLAVGEIYTADGYRADVYLAHPITGDIFRPELSVTMDIRSRFIAGWRADENEHSIGVQSLFADAYARHDHVPPMKYIDNGSGYRNQFVNDDTIGFYKRAGVVDIIYALPGNPHGKGWIERFFLYMKEDFLKTWMPAFYCGDDMADEVRNQIVRDVKAGNIKPPSLKQFTDAFNDWLDRYHARPHPEIEDISPAEMWASLNRIPPVHSALELKRRMAKLTVRRASVTHKRISYGHPDLIAFNGQKVILEFDFMDNSVGIIRTLDGVFICDAHLITPIDVIPENRLEQARQTSAKQAVKRLEKKIAEQNARAGRLIDATHYLDADIAIESPTTDEEIILNLLEV